MDLTRLFFTFFQIGLFSIGGGYAIIPSIQEQVVERAGWISEKMFTDIITISQMTPGPLAVNTSTFVGLQIAGIAGAVTATVGCIISGAVLSLLLYRFFQKHHSSACIFEILNGLKSASLGLIISAAATIVLLAFWGDASPASLAKADLRAALIFAAVFLIMRTRRCNPVILMTVSGIAGAILYL